MQQTETENTPQFLTGGGEMGALIRQKDWSETPLGCPETWPQSLRTTLNILLHSKFPMFLWWGPELICFYNDAYRPSLGKSGKHPDILGQKAEVAWPEIWHIIKPMIDQVLDGGESTWNEDQLIPIYRNGKIEDVYWTFSYSAVQDETGLPAGVFVTCYETTQQVDTRKQLEEKEKRFRNIVHQAPMGITILRGPDFIVEMANEVYLSVVDREEIAFVGKPLFESLPEVEHSVKPLLSQVFTTGNPFYGNEFPVTLHRHGKRELTYFNFVYDALREDDGSISGIVVVSTEVTDMVKAKHTLAESEKQFRNMVFQSPIAMTIFRGEEFVIEMGNTVMVEKIWRKKLEDVMGKKLLDVFPELSGQKYPELLREVYKTGKLYKENDAVAYVQGDDGLKKFYLDYEYAPLLEPDGSISGVLVTVNDVTEKVEARIRVEENKEKLDVVINASELGTWELNPKTSEVSYSDRYLEILGYQNRVDLNHTQLLRHLHPDDFEVRQKAFQQAFETGHLHYITRLIWSDESLHWVEAKGKVFYDDSGEPQLFVGTLRDITEEKQYEQKLKEREQKFRLLADSMPQFVWTSDAEGRVDYFNQAMYDYTGLSPDDLENDGWIQVIHPDDLVENIRLWTTSIKTGNDYHCEHRFRCKEGEYRWQLSRAIPQRDESGIIQMWVGTSTDIQDQKVFTQELEIQVQERTRLLQESNEKLENSIKDLQKMNAELQSFAYVSSHDLQEPLRKIQAFAGRILEREQQNLSETGKDYLKRMHESARRMQRLIEDLLAYSRTNTTERVFRKTNLVHIINEVKHELKEQIEEKHAVIAIEVDCEIPVIPFQFTQLMQNLMGNALKFSKPGIPPLIQIKSEMVSGDSAGITGLAPQKTYCHLTVSDNGIGFAAQYKERIFEVFQRLHGKDEYRGTGIGLAIVKKIVENHDGVVIASGTEGEGAVFEMYIPA